MSRNSMKLLYQWTSGNGSFRLLEDTAYHYGPTKKYIVEQDKKDSLGGPKWELVYAWTKVTRMESYDDALTALVALLDKKSTAYRSTLKDDVARARFEAVRARMVRLFGEDMADIKALEMLAEYAIDDRVTGAPWEMT